MKSRWPLLLTLLLTACAPRVSRFYTFTHLAGSEGGPGYADGEAHEARFVQAHGLALDADGYLYVSDRAAHTIRKVSPDGTVSTLAGLAGEPGAADGRGHRARFNWPQGLALDGGGNLYVADTDNQLIRRITREGDVSTVAGRLSMADHFDDAGVAACFRGPAGLAFDRHGFLYVADEWNQSRVLDPQNACKRPLTEVPKQASRVGRSVRGVRKRHVEYNPIEPGEVAEHLHLLNLDRTSSLANHPF